MALGRCSNEDEREEPKTKKLPIFETLPGVIKYQKTRLPCNDPPRLATTLRYTFAYVIEHEPSMRVGLCLMK